MLLLEHRNLSLLLLEKAFPFRADLSIEGFLHPEKQIGNRKSLKLFLFGWKEQGGVSIHLLPVVRQEIVSYHMHSQ